METREYRTIDKGAWGDGAWQSEPDKMQWQDEATGLPCLVVRNHGGALCGYVGVAEGHPYFGRHYDSVDVSVHGGLTFSDFCTDDADEAAHICHVPDPGEPHRVWWLGFDCAHYSDKVPGYDSKYPGMRDGDGIYRTLDYVRDEVRRLAEQIASVK